MTDRPICPACGATGWHDMIEVDFGGAFVEKRPGQAHCPNEDDEQHVAYWANWRRRSA